LEFKLEEETELHLAGACRKKINFNCVSENEETVSDLTEDLLVDEHD